MFLVEGNIFLSFFKYLVTNSRAAAVRWEVLYLVSYFCIFWLRRWLCVVCSLLFCRWEGAMMLVYLGEGCVGGEK
jgi:hypothetical protein